MTTIDGITNIRDFSQQHHHRESLVFFRCMLCSLSCFLSFCSVVVGKFKRDTIGKDEESMRDAVCHPLLMEIGLSQAEAAAQAVIWVFVFAGSIRYIIQRGEEDWPKIQ